MTADLGAQWRPGDPCFKCGLPTVVNVFSGPEYGLCNPCGLAFKWSNEPDPNTLPAIMPGPLSGDGWTMLTKIGRLRPTTPPDPATGPDGDET